MADRDARGRYLKAAPDAPASGEFLSVGDAVAGTGVAKPGPQPNDLATYWMLYQRHPWVQTCVSLIAEAVASESFTITPVDGVSGDARGSQDDPRQGQIHQFFAGAARGSTFTSLRLALATDLRVFGLAYLRKRRAKGKGLPLFLERLDPRRVSVALDAAKTAVASFTLRTSDDGRIDAGERLEPKDVVFIRMAGGDTIFGASSPLEALDLTISQDWSIRKFRESYFRNGGVSGRIVLIPGASEEQARKFTKELNSKKSGIDNAFRDLVLPGKDVTVIQRGASQGGNDFDFLKGSESLRDEIFAVYKVPPGKIFATAGLGHAGKRDDDVTFQRDAVLPVERALYEALTQDVLLAEFGISDLRLVPARLDNLAIDMFDAAAKMLLAGGTPNEARELMGLPTISDGTLAMDVPVLLGARQTIADSEVPATGDRSGDVTLVADQANPQAVVKAGAANAEATFRRRLRYDIGRA